MRQRMQGHRAGAGKRPAGQRAPACPVPLLTFVALRSNAAAQTLDQIVRELKRQFAGKMLTPEQLKGLIHAGYVYRNGEEHHLTPQGREALARAGVNPEGAHQRDGVP